MQPGGLGVGDACVRFPLLHREADRMRDLFVFLMITVCCSSHPDPSLLLVSRLVYDLVP